MSSFLDKKDFQAKILYYGIIALLIYIPFHPFLTAWLGSLIGVYAPIKIWKDVLVALVAVIAVAYSLSDGSVRKKFWTDRLNLLVLFYVIVHFLTFLFFDNFSEESAYAGLIFNLRFLAFFMVVRVFVTAFPNKAESLKNDAIKVMLGAALVVGVVAVAQLTIPTESVYKFFGYDGVNTIAPVSYVDNNPNAPRSFSTLRGPNELGAFLITPITLLGVLLLGGGRRWYAYGVFVVLLIALAGSYSRSALVGCIASLAIALTFYYGHRINFKHKLFLAITVSVTLAITIWLSLSVPSLRLFIYHSSPGDSHLFEGSTEDHFRATAKGIGDVADNPFGRGPGESGPASFYQSDDLPRIPENYYVQIAQEVGILGLLIFIAILVSIGKRLYTERSSSLALAFFASFVGLSVANVFLHTWADDPTAYIWWGLVALILPTSRLTR